MKLEIKESKIVGRGSFATEGVKKGETIKVLTGERVSREETEKRINEGREYVDDPLQIGDNLYLDLDESSRLINHSCDPNSGICGESELFAIKNIEKGEEITFDYSTTVGKNISWYMKCNCSSKNCRKKIGNVLTIPKETLKRYNQAGALPDFIRNQIIDELS